MTHRAYSGETYIRVYRHPLSTVADVVQCHDVIPFDIMFVFCEEVCMYLETYMRVTDWVLDLLPIASICTAV